MIRLNDRWSVRTDDNCCTLVRTVVITGGGTRPTKAENIGKEREQVVGYYANLVQALTAFLEKAGREEADELNLPIQQITDRWAVHMQEIVDAVQ